MDPTTLAAKLAEARTAIADAEAELDRLMQRIEPSSRPEKTLITESLQAAFERVRAARKALNELDAPR